MGNGKEYQLQTMSHHSFPLVLLKWILHISQVPRLANSEQL